MPTRKPIPPAEVARGALEEIDANGWFQLAPGNYTDGPGSACLVVATHRSLGQLFHYSSSAAISWDKSLTAVQRALLDEIGRQDPEWRDPNFNPEAIQASLTAWNDTAGRTLQQVRSILTAVAGEEAA